MSQYNSRVARQSVFAFPRPSTSIRASLSNARRAPAPAVPDDRSSTAVDGHGASGNHFRHAVDRARVMPDLEALVDGVVTTIAATAPTPDAILGRFVRLTSLARSISFHEGRLLEAALVRLAEINPDLIVLSQGLRLPITKAAIEAVANNSIEKLRSLTLDSEVAARSCYTPDVILIDRRRHAAQILDMKRSVASYVENRIEDLKARMMAAALVFPDWLYREHKRLFVDDVSIGIIDGASAKSDEAAGIWALADIDRLIDVHGAADIILEMRRSFGARVQTLLRAEARAALTDPSDHRMRVVHPTRLDAWGETLQTSAVAAALLDDPHAPIDGDDVADDVANADRNEGDDDGGWQETRPPVCRANRLDTPPPSRAPTEAEVGHDPHTDADRHRVRFGLLRPVPVH